MVPNGLEAGSSVRRAIWEMNVGGAATEEVTERKRPPL
jgi:hypothetical protein